MVSICFDKKNSKQKGCWATLRLILPFVLTFPVVWSETSESDSVLISANVVAI